MWRWSLAEGGPRSENTLQTLFRWPRGLLAPEFRCPPRERVESGKEELTRRRGDAEGLETAFAQKDKKGGWNAGGRSTLKTMKTALRTWKGGRDAAVQSGRGRPAREASGKRKTSEKTNIFRNLTSSGAAGCRTSGSHALLVQEVLHHFRGCGILPRPSGWRAEAGRRGQTGMGCGNVPASVQTGLQRSGAVADEGQHGGAFRRQGERFARCGGNLRAEFPDAAPQGRRADADFLREFPPVARLD